MGEQNDKYRLVFTGKVVNGFTREDVSGRLQKLLHLDARQAQRLLEGRHRQIDKSLGYDRANRLRQMIMQEGAECFLLPIEQAFDDTQPLLLDFGADGEAVAGIDLSDQSGDPAPGHTPAARNTWIFSGLLASVIVISLLVIWFVFLPMNQAQDESVATPEKRKLPAKQSESIDPEYETIDRIAALAGRVSMWFASYGQGVSPDQISWIWIQGDLNIKVRETNDGWGRPIQYEGAAKGYTLRSAGPDMVFGTEDDLTHFTAVE